MTRADPINPRLPSHTQYGEFPLTGLLKLLEHPAVDEALHAAEHKEGSVDEADKISRAHAFFEDCDPNDEACDLEHTKNAFQPSLVDIGSGAGRLVLAAATMRPWRSVTGIEASKPLAGLGAAAIKKLEDGNVVEKGKFISTLVRAIRLTSCFVFCPQACYVPSTQTPISPADD
jgi:hypothetical protein